MERVDYLFITNSLSGGGAERAINIAVNEISKQGVSVGLLVVNEGPQDLFAPKVPTFEINRKWRGGPISVFMAFLKVYYLAIRIRPKALVLNCDLPEFLGAFLFGPWQLIAVEHVPKPWSDRLSLGKIVRRVLRSRKTSWVVVSDHLVPWLNADLMRIHIPNAIFENDHAAMNLLSIGNETKRLVFIGRLTKAQKQPQWMLDIAEITNLPVAFYGDGLFHAELLSNSKDRNINATFYGFVLNPWNEISNGDLLIIPSAWEGDGLVVVEALSRGVPMLLNSIDDLTRFGLPAKHYSKSPDDFAININVHRNNLSDLVADIEIAQRIIAGRNPKNVAEKWIDFLKSVAN
jgi:glycosyltransferase involved in cell wall biosynthesis